MNHSFGIIFDMDGVLVNSNPYHKIALQQFARQHGHELSEKELKEKVYGRTNREWLTNLFGALPEDKLRQYAEEKEALYRELFKADIAPVAGLLPFLQHLREHQVPVAIGTSAPRSNVDFTLRHTGTEAYFAIVLDDTFVTHGKPDPEIYLKAAQALNLPNDRCIVIEDSLSGVEAGLRAGSKVIGITTTHTAEELAGTHLVIDDFTRLRMPQLLHLF
jgi:HAD superfamily hydrolase (TIGR01509 family)